MIPTIIEDVKARKIVDSRGNWTIEVDVITDYAVGRCAAPSGASTGKYEARAFPEGGIEKAIIEVEETIAPELRGMDAINQEEIDQTLHEIDGTENFSNIGGNTAVAVSLANAKAAAASYGIPLFQFLGGNFSCELPYPLGNVIGGGAHANNATDIQEFLVIPIGARDIAEAICTNAEVHKKLKGELVKRSSGTLGKGDEGAWAPAIGDVEALNVLSEVCDRVAQETGVKLRIGLDVAASQLWNEKKQRYVYPREGKERTSEEQVDYIAGLIEDYNLYYVEDPVQEEDFETFAQLTSRVKALICGDDLYVTNEDRLRRGIEKGSTNAILIKPNQCGTLTDTFRAINLAKNEKLTPVISHRSGETTDESIAHLAVAFHIPIIKTGVIGGERIAKLNELIRIAEELTPSRAKLARLPKF
jgi:enolase